MRRSEDWFREATSGRADKLYTISLLMVVLDWLTVGIMQATWARAEGMAREGA